MYFDPRLWQFTKGVRDRIAGAVMIGLLAAALGIARLALLGWLLAKIFRGEPFDAMIVPFATVAGVMALRGVLEYWRNMVAHRTAARVQRHLRKRLYDKVIELGPAHFGLRRTGDVMLSMIDGVEQLETYFGQYLPQIFVALFTPIAVFAFVAFLDIPVAVLLVAAALIALIAPSAFQRWNRKSSRSRAKSYGDFSAEFLDSVQGLVTLKAFGQSAARARVLAEKARGLFRSTMWLLAVSAASRGITDMAIAVGAAATVGFGAYRVNAGAMEIEVLLVVLMMGTEVFRPLRDLRSLIHQGMAGQAAALAVFSILDATPSVDPEATGEAVDGELSPTVEIENVSFAYPGTRRPVHRGLNIAAAAGERVGVVGLSGAGKSSIVRLLLRLYDPQVGSIRLGGRDIKELGLDRIRAQLAIVNQDTYLFHGTVEDNLRFGKPEATGEELVAAARAANAHDFITRLPRGYQTVVGERGCRLSGGQRQRITIARALLRDAPILVLDEALSSVDAENEAVIQEALDRLMRGRTTIIFAHRLSSVIDADRILVLEDGHVVESGAHGELMARRGAYWRLMAGQAQDGGGGALPPGGEAGDRPATEGPEPASFDDAAQMAPTDAILRAEGMGWLSALAALLRLVASRKGRLMLAFVLGIARVLAFIGVGVLSALMVAAVKAGTPFDAYLLALGLVAPLAGVLHWLESWVAHDMAYRLLAEMRIALFNKLDRLAPAYLLRRRTGDLVAMATQDVETVEYFFAHTVAPAFVAVLVPGAVLATLFAFGWPMALALIPFLAAVILSPFLMRRRVDEFASRAREALGELNAHVVDTIQGLGEIVAFQQAARRGAAFDRLVHDHHRARLPFFRDLTIQTAMVEVATGLGGLMVIIAGARLVAAGDLVSGLLPLLTLLAMSAFLPVSEIANIGRQLADTLGATRRIHSVHGEEVTVIDGAGVPAAAAGVGVSLEIDGVDFTYDGADRGSLSEVSFTVPAGGTVALVGSSGAGKTTAAHLLMRFFDPARGVVRMNGHDLKDYRLDDLRRQIALVSQDTFLFNDSLRANIAIAQPSASETDLSAAVERAALADFVASLPEGLETRVGERGVQLSGGQRQRVAIARAFLKDAPVLILDEATSHLDFVNERTVHRALEDLMSHRTTVLIAHRLSTIRNADSIVVMDQGRVVESGTHPELLARGGLYAHLVARQLAGSAAAAAD